MKKHTFEAFKDALEVMDYILVSDKSEYKNVGTKMKYVCKKHEEKGIQETTYGRILEGKGCYYCGHEKAGIARRVDISKTIEEDRLLAESKGFIYIDTYKDGGSIYIKFICKKHIELGEQVMKKWNMKRDIKGCKYCKGNIPKWYALEKAKKIAPHIEILDEYKNLTTRMNCYCTKHNHYAHKTMQEILKGQGCYYCGLDKLSEMHTLTIEQAQERVNVKTPHVKVLEYNGVGHPVKLFCEKHQIEYIRTHSGAVNGNSGCDLCVKEDVHEDTAMGIEEFKRRLSILHPELVVLGKYVNNSTPIEVYCTKHENNFASTPASLLNRVSCCDKSIVRSKEVQIVNWLEKIGFRLTRQKQFDDCIDKRKLRFDIYLDDYNVIIEYDGEQHFRPVRFGKESEEETLERFEYCKYHDLIKDEYCKNNGIPIIRIPYYEFKHFDKLLKSELEKLNIRISSAA